MIHHIIGDASKPVGDGDKYVVHVTNDLGGWGAGFTTSIDENLGSTPREEYRASQHVFGEVLFSPTSRKYVQVVSMCCQHGYKSIANPVPLDYLKLGIALGYVYGLASAQSIQIHMPRIGSGLAGGDWNTIYDRIEKFSIGYDVDTYIYTLPTKV